MAESSTTSTFGTSPSFQSVNLPWSGDLTDRRATTARVADQGHGRAPGSVHPFAADAATQETLARPNRPSPEGRGQTDGLRPRAAARRLEANKSPGNEA